MNLFRSEEHIERWLAGRPPGTMIPVTKLCALAHDWWGDRLSPDWRPPHPRPEPSDPRQPRAHRGVLAASLRSRAFRVLVRTRIRPHDGGCSRSKRKLAALPLLVQTSAERTAA